MSVVVSIIRITKFIRFFLVLLDFCFYLTLMSNKEMQE